MSHMFLDSEEAQPAPAAVDHAEVSKVDEDVSPQPTISRKSGHPDDSDNSDDEENIIKVNAEDLMSENDEIIHDSKMQNDND